MQDEINCDEPQFINMFESCLRVEVEAAKNTLLGFESEVKDFKAKVQSQLKTRKELKERMKNTQENVSILTATLNKQTKHVAEISDTIELMKVNLDSDYKIMMLESERRENILKEYKDTWQTYQAKYEDFPLMKTRKEAKMKLEKLRVQQMVIQYKINEIKKALRQREHIAWLRLRERIVEFAREMLKHRAFDQKLINLNKGIVDLKEELNAMDNERAAQLQVQEEEKKVRVLKMLEMPPPKVNFFHMRTLYGSGLKSNSVDDWKRNFENPFDSMSIDTVMLEEMCLADENPQQPSCQNSKQIQPNMSCSPENASIDSSKSQEEMEHEDAIDMAVDEEPDQRMDDEVQQESLKESVVPSSGDKRTVEENEDYQEEEEVPATKKMKLIVEEDKTVSPTSILKDMRPERTKSQLVDEFTGPRIARIQKIRYNVLPMTKVPQVKPNPSRTFGPDKGNSSSRNVAGEEAHLVDGFASPRILNIGTDVYNVSPMAKTTKSKPNTPSIHLPHGFPSSEILKDGIDRFNVSPMMKTVQSKLNSSSSHLLNRSPGPRISRRETDCYKVSPMMKRALSNLNIFRGSHTPDRSSGPGMSRIGTDRSKVSSASQIVQSKPSTPSSHLPNKSPRPGFSRIGADRYNVSPMTKIAQGNSNPSSSHKTVPSPSPSTSRIDAARYNASPMLKMVQNKPNISSRHVADGSLGPGISKIEADRYNVSPMRKMTQRNLNPSRTLNYGYSDKNNSSFCANSNVAAERGSHLADGSPGSGITRIVEDRYNISPIRKPNSANSNPSSMFTPGNYDYFNNSNISFSTNNNLPDLKGDQISLFEGSIRDFCGYSDISTPIENQLMDPIATNTVNLPMANTGQTSPQFDFSSILKNKPARNILF